MIVYGKNVIKNLLEANHKIEELIVQDSLKSKYEDLIVKLKKQATSVTYLPKKDMDKLYSGNHQGIVAKAKDYQYADLDEELKKLKDPFIVMLDGLTDPHNLGAILRTADCTKCDLVIIPKKRTVPLNATVAKVSTGAIEYVKVCQVSNLHQTIAKLKKNHVWVYGTDMSAKLNYNQVDYTGGVCIVVGNEGKGISPLVKKNCDYLVKIPMSGHVDSLNASVSAALLMYEVYNNRF